MKKVQIIYWALSEFPDLLALGLEHKSIHELPENEIGELIKNIADRGYYAFLKKTQTGLTDIEIEHDYYIAIDNRRFTQR